MKINHIPAILVVLALSAGLLSLTGCSQEPAPQKDSGQSSQPAQQQGQSGSASGESTEPSTGPTDGDAPVPDGNSVSTDLYTLYFDRDLTATVDEDYASGNTAFGYQTTVEKDGQPYYYVAAFGTQWGPEGDYYSAQVGSTTDSEGNPVNIYVYGFCDVVTQQVIDQAATQVEVK